MSDDLLAIFQALDDTDERAREGYVRSPLNYTGSKSESLGELLQIMPYEDIWVDVFGGSGVVTLNRRKSKLEVFNDRDSGVTAFFRAIVEDVDRLIETIELMPHSRELFTYCKESIDAEQDTIIRGAKWYYLVQASFNGRAQSFGRVTKSASGQIWKKLRNNLSLFHTVHKRFVVDGIQVENADWRDVFKDYDTHKTVWYLDPPYVNSNMYNHGMSKKDHTEMCHRIFDLEGWVGLSGFADCKPIYDKFEWDECYVFEVKNNTKGLSRDESGRVKVNHNLMDDRDNRFEYLWVKDFS